MLFTISTTLLPPHPATDLGYLLHKNPAKAQRFELSFGHATVFYTEATETRCTATLLLEVDPVTLVRKRGNAFALDQYVNDRPYAASSLLSVAITQVFGTALAGTCKQRPELAATPIPLEVTLPVLPCRGGPDLLDRFFGPLGYTIESARLPLDDRFPEWGESPYHRVTLRNTVRLSDMLSHVYVLVPVLDDDKHYWVDDAEVEKLLRHGEGWLPAHPARDTITGRYLRYRKHLQSHANEAMDALIRLEAGEARAPTEPDEAVATEAVPTPPAVTEDAPPPPPSLNHQRHEAVVAAVLASGATSVLDLGCAQGTLLRRLLPEKQLTRIVGLDVSMRALEVASGRLRLERMHESRRDRIELLHGSLIYRDKRLEGFDAACLVEVIEHLDPPRLESLEKVVYRYARPRTVIVTTPNIEYNTRFPTLAAGSLRHRDHRFEWTRAQFSGWARRVAETFGYQLSLSSIGPEDPEVGSPTQMALFLRGGT